MKLSIKKVRFMVVMAGMWGMVCTEGAWGQVLGNTTTTGLRNFQGNAPLGSSELGSFRAYSTSIESNYDTSRSNSLFQNFSDSGMLTNTGMMRGGSVKNDYRLRPSAMGSQIQMLQDPLSQIGGGVGMAAPRPRGSFVGRGNAYSEFSAGSGLLSGNPFLRSGNRGSGEFGVQTKELMEGKKKESGYIGRYGLLENRDRLSEKVEGAFLQRRDKMGLSERAGLYERFFGMSQPLNFAEGGSFGHSWPSGRKGLADQGKGRVLSKGIVPMSRLLAK